MILPNPWKVVGSILFFIAIASGLWLIIDYFGDGIGILGRAQKITLWFIVLTLILLIRLISIIVPLYLLKKAQNDAEKAGVYPEQEQRLAQLKAQENALQPMVEGLRLHHGRFWRRKVRILLVIGEPEQVEAIAPGLTLQRWLEGNNTLLLWGGSVQADPNEELIARLRALRRRRPLDGIVWAVTETQGAQPKHIYLGLRQLLRQGQRLGWQAPLYLWQVCDSAWAQGDLPGAPVGCLLPAACTSEYLSARLLDLIAPLRREGMGQVLATTRHDFLLRLSLYLEREGITHWQQALVPLWRDFSCALSLRGMMFSLPVNDKASGTGHGWCSDPAWQGIVNDSSARGRRAGFSWERNAFYAVLGLTLLWGGGSLLSFISNRSHIVTAREQLTALREDVPIGEQLKALRQLANELGRLQYLSSHGAPWYQRFGLNQSGMLSAALWPRYGAMNNRLVRDGAAKQLSFHLAELVALPPHSPQRAKRALVGYGRLKAYLMLAYPEKADADFLTRILEENEPVRAGVATGLWRSLSPGLWSFYAVNLAEHPEWRIVPDADLVAQVRRLLLVQIGQRNAEATLYQKILQSVSNNYAELGLMHMVGDRDAQGLFSSTEVVPGVFTRQAWEGQVQKAIDEAVASRREEIDWVLSDATHPVTAEVSPEALEERLTERYFTDFSGAWLNFLNSLRWKQAKNLSDVTDQLTLMADVRQSPLIALMNTLSYQGQTGQRGAALSDSLVKSVQSLLHKDDLPAIDQRAAGLTGPLDGTFGPLLAMMGKGSPAGVMTGDSSLSLQTFLTRITRVRLKLQQVANANDPQEMTQLLAQTVFQGKSIDLTDTQEYGSLLAASLGEEWSGFGRAVFVQPLAQAWQKVLQPSAASLNVQWRTSIADNWDRAFNGRYPFADTRRDASLPMLGQFVRTESGRIEQFLTRQLSGVLHKEGNRWVPDKLNSQGLHFNPAFLRAVNHLSQLADILYTNGGMGISFELMAKPVHDVVETTFNLDGQKLRYFNQKESWQNFHWPGASDKPGVMLSWSSVNAGPRLFADEQGTWGLIRLLEQAKVTALDDGDTLYRLVLTGPDDLPLTWNLRTELAEGPLALLKLRGFSLPARIFDVDAGGGTMPRNTAAIGGDG
jgi:type VI secretion system protein ImpL